MPLSPVQVIEGSWPQPAQVVSVAASKPYSIQGDTFSFPALGFSVKRASQAKWAFNPGNNSVQITYKVNGTEPTPSLAVLLEPLPAGTNIQSAEQSDITSYKGKGATLTSSGKRTIGNLKADEYVLQQTDQTSGITVTLDLVYLVSGQTIAVIEAQADSGTFNQLSDDFNTMIGSIVMPGATAGSDTSAQPAAGATGTSGASGS